ncbi:MAG: quinolinate synthase NadA [Bdellovibrionales bacterium]|nr:quinolinate synthase NadA [Bdellovibrionales bacterium]
MSIEASSISETLTLMRERLSRVVPDAELQIKAELVYEINRLKKERGAIILGHNYMEPALFHTVPDLAGDSLGLSREAAKTEKDPIIFCGVRFMAETAKILNPKKTVLLPAKVAGCSLAASITAEDVRALKAKYPGVPVVVYVNTYADVKAEADYCCTSSNAAKVLEHLGAPKVLFLPDEYLAKNTAIESGRPYMVVGKTSDGNLVESEVFPGQEGKGLVIAWHGKCEVHEQFTVEDIENARKQFPEIEVITHPESSPDVVEASDYSGSTTRLVQYVKDSPKKQFLILTECSMGDNIIAEAPDKEIARLCSVRCPHMNEITLEDVLHALTHNETRIELDEDLRQRALLSVERMLQIG